MDRNMACHGPGSVWGAIVTGTQRATSVAAIAGGVSEGVVIIAIIGLGIFCLLRRKNRAFLSMAHTSQSTPSLDEANGQQGNFIHISAVTTTSYSTTDTAFNTDAERGQR